MKTTSLFLVLLMGALGASGCAHRPSGEELEVLTRALKLEAGSTIADLGAGDGRISVELARRVGAQGRVVASEVDGALREAIAQRARDEHLDNISVVAAGDAETGLEAGCCDAVLLRGVYHHLAQPEATLAGIVAALKPDGRLVVVDFPPTAFLAAWRSAEQRRGHGVERDEVVDEVKRAGLEHTGDIAPYPGLWPLPAYAVVFRKAVSQ